MTNESVTLITNRMTSLVRKFRAVAKIYEGLNAEDRKMLRDMLYDAFPDPDAVAPEAK